MDYIRKENTIILRLDRGEIIQDAILKLTHLEGISLAGVQGIGATDNFCIGVFDPVTKQYDQHSFIGNHEITCLCGNITTKGGQPYAHLHISCANSEGKMFGGHLVNAVISLTAEIIITIFDGTVERHLDENLGFNAMSFNTVCVQQ